MDRSPLLGIPAACAAGLLLVSVAAVAQATVADPTLGTGVPDMALFGFGFLVVFVLPAAVTALVTAGLALVGTRRLQQGRPGTLATVSWLSLVGCGWCADLADDTTRQAVGAAGVVLALITLVGLDIVARHGSAAGTTGA